MSIKNNGKNKFKFSVEELTLNQNSAKIINPTKFRCLSKKESSLIKLLRECLE